MAHKGPKQEGPDVLTADTKKKQAGLFVKDTMNDLIFREHTVGRLAAAKHGGQALLDFDQSLTNTFNARARRRRNSKTLLGVKQDRSGFSIPGFSGFGSFSPLNFSRPPQTILGG